MYHHVWPVVALSLGHGFRSSSLEPNYVYSWETIVMAIHQGENFVAYKTLISTAPPLGEQVALKLLAAAGFQHLCLFLGM